MGEHDELELELQSVERQLEAVDRRLADPTHADTTSAAVLEDERATRTALLAELERLRARLASRKTPVAGTVSANVGMWQPLSLHERMTPAEEDLPPFAVEAEEPRKLEELERELAEMFTSALASGELSSVLQPLRRCIARWAKLPAARRFLAAGLRSLNRPRQADTLSSELPIPPAQPHVLHSPLLDEAADFPDALTGLTDLETQVLRSLAQTAPAGGRFARLSEIARESGLEEAQVSRCLGTMGHPSLRRLPLVEFQGFAGRFDPVGPTFTHARLTLTGSQLLDGSLALPMLLVNGAAGRGTCVPPLRPADLLTAARRLIWEPGLGWPDFYSLVGAADFPDGAQVSRYGASELWRLGHLSGLARACIDLELDVRATAARLVVHRFPWPLRAAQVRPLIEERLHAGQLDGVRAIRDESAADANRLVLELEHIVFALPVRERLWTSRLLEVRFEAALNVSGSAPEVMRRFVLMDLLRAFVEARIRRQMNLLAERIHLARERALNLEAVYVALLLKDRVLAALREAVSDDEAAELVQGCLLGADLSPLALTGVAHDYSSGFTPTQAQFLARQRKLASRTHTVAKQDWSHALVAVEDARALAFDSRRVRQLVHDELLEAERRFSEARRSTLF